MENQQINRREFLNRSAVAAAGMAAASLAGPASLRAAGANERIVLGFVGCGGRGTWLLGEMFARNKNLDFAYMCDPDSGRLAAGIKSAEKATGKAPKAAKDFREILDDKNVDALFNVHARPLARPRHDPGLPGRQGRLRREARLAQRLGRPQDGRGRPQVQPRRAARHPDPQRATTPARPSSTSGPASSARSTSSAC